MRKGLRDLMAWTDSRQPRERALLFAAFATGVFGLWNLGLMGPLRERQETVDAKVQEAERQIRALQAQGEKILHASSLDLNRDLQNRAETLRRQIDSLDARIREHTVTLIPPMETRRRS